VAAHLAHTGVLGGEAAAGLAGGVNVMLIAQASLRGVRVEGGAVWCDDAAVHLLQW
jgi:hypothetical protein